MAVVRALDSGPRGREFDSRRVRYQVTTLRKLFTSTCLCRCTWSSGWCRLVIFRLRFDSHRGSFASNLEQVANLLCAQVNSTSYPQRDGQWVVAYRLRREDLVADWGGGMSASCNRGSNCLPTDAMDGRIVRCGIISSCQPAVASEIVKALLVASLTHVSGAIASTRPLQDICKQNSNLWEQFIVFWSDCRWVTADRKFHWREASACHFRKCLYTATCNNLHWNTRTKYIAEAEKKTTNTNLTTIQGP